MTTGAYVVGVDFGTASGRAVLVDCADGRELASASYAYANGVIDERLPEPHDHVRLEPDWALQDPEDYLRTFEHAVPRVLAESGIDAGEVIGIGIDFTSCTMLPTTADGTPLCLLEELRGEPHAWVKLWKHHAAQPEADRINAVAAERGEPWLARYGGKISSEWFFAKALQILDEAPELYDRAERLIEAADWVVWQLTGTETRNTLHRRLQGDVVEAGRVSRQRLLRRARPALRARRRREDVAHAPAARQQSGRPDRASSGADRPPRRARRSRSPTSTPTSRLPAATVTEPGSMVVIMGTSNCHILLGDELAFVEGMCGAVEDGVVPGLIGYEAGQSGVGDIFAWFAEHVRCRPSTTRRPERQGEDVHRILEQEAAKLRPGESGLLALDWWNGNRSVLVDADLSGLLVGMTLATKAPEIYRALIEATAFGTRVIVEAFESAGVPVTRIVACGGLPERNELLMQIYADVTGRAFSVAASAQTPALGAAMFGGGRGGRGGRRLRLDRRGLAPDGASERARLRADRRPSRGLQRPLRPVRPPARPLRA